MSALKSGGHCAPHRLNKTGDVILSRAPNSWDAFFALRGEGVEEAADFLRNRV